MPLDQYIRSFSHLRTYKDRKKWSSLTIYQAPHKPFLLLSIMDLIAQESITENFKELRYQDYQGEVMQGCMGRAESLYPQGVSS
ncbi:MAG: hypothetical protein IMF02_10235 [Proteobacteria bacterium]|nr:hypothetical protein [Pseudomonadota bacterium]